MCVTDTRWHVLIGVSPAVIRGMSLWTCLRQLDSDNGLTVTSRLSRVDWFDWFSSVMCVIDKAHTIVLCKSWLWQWNCVCRKREALRMEPPTSSFILVFIAFIALMGLLTDTINLRLTVLSQAFGVKLVQDEACSLLVLI
jgi:hypothetical protein